MVANEAKQGTPDVARFILTLRRRKDGPWLISTRLTEDLSPPVPGLGTPFTADQLMAQLDSAGIRRAVVLSVAYWFGAPPSIMKNPEGELSIAEEYARVRAENDWAAEQVARYPSRLVAFCSFNPLKPYALEELGRCSRRGGIRGIKLHLANSGVDLRRTDDVTQLREIFRAANQQRMPMVVHMRPRAKPYGREDAEIFLRELVSQAPDIPIQIAHLAGWGGWDDATDEAAGVFAEAITKANPKLPHLYFDLTSIVFPGHSRETLKQIAERTRQLGLRRVVYGSDLADPGKTWADVVNFLPLTRAELQIIADNVTPYLR